MTEKMYDMICKDEFEKLNKGQTEILNILKGGGIKEPGLVDDVRELKKIFRDNPSLVDDVKSFKKVYKCSIAAITAVLLVIVKEIMNWIFNKS